MAALTPIDLRNHVPKLRQHIRSTTQYHSSRREPSATAETATRDARVQVPKPQNRSRPDAPRPPNSQKLELPLTLNLPSASPGRRPTWQSKQAPHHKPSPFAHPSGTLPPCHAPTTMYYVCRPCLPRLCETAPFPRQAASQGEERREKDSEPCSARYRAFVRAKKSHVRWLNPSGGLLCYVSRERCARLLGLGGTGDFLVEVGGGVAVRRL